MRNWTSCCQQHDLKILLALHGTISIAPIFINLKNYKTFVGRDLKIWNMLKGSPTILQFTKHRILFCATWNGFRISFVWLSLKPTMCNGNKMCAWFVLRLSNYTFFTVMCADIYIYIYICVCVCVFVFVWVYIYVYIHIVCLCECTYMCIYTLCVFVWVYIYVYIHIVCVCVSVHICVYIHCVCLCECTYMCIYTLWVYICVYIHCVCLCECTYMCIHIVCVCVSVHMCVYMSIYIFTYLLNRNWVATQLQLYSTHLHTISTQNDTKIILRTTQKFWKSVGHAPSLRVITWHLPYNWGKSTEKPQSG